MRHAKMLGLLAVAAAAMMAFAATASADTVTTTVETPPQGQLHTFTTPTIHTENEGGHVSIQNPIATISCQSTIETTVTTHPSGQPVGIHISHLTFTGCTNSWHVTTVTAGTLSLEASTGALTSNGAKVDTTRFGVTCVYETSNTPIGTVTGGSPATLHIEASIPLNDPESGALCGSGNAKWEGNYVTTHRLHLDNN
jgi:hypothetical protein